MFIFAITIPPTRAQAIGRLAHENSSIPASDGFSKHSREVRAAVHYPPYRFGPWGRREYARTQRRVRTSAAEDVLDGRLGWCELDLI
jgi:hypothetical protein